MILSRLLLLSQLLAAATLTPVVFGALGLGGAGMVVSESRAEPKSAPPPIVEAALPPIAEAPAPAECKIVRVAYRGYGEPAAPRCAPTGPAR